MKNIKKSLLFSVILIFSLALFQSAASAATLQAPSKEVTNTQNNNKLELNQKVNNNNTNNINIQPNSVNGGGAVSCQGFTGYAECDISYIGVDPLSSGQLTIKFYKIVNGTKTLNKYYDIPVRSLNGKTWFEDVETPVLTKGDYQASLSGYLYGYDSDVPYNVSTVWSAKFTVK